MDIVTSVHNERVKQARALRERRERQARGLLCIEGPRFVRDAAEAGAEIQCCFAVAERLSPDDWRLLHELQGAGTELVMVTARVMDSLADTKTPQGLFAVAKAPPSRSGEQLLGAGKLVLVADEIRDPGNLGTMLRTAAAVGAGVILLAGCADPTGPKVVRSSAGACYAVPMWIGPSVGEVIAALRQAGCQAVVLDMNGPTSLYSADLRRPVALVVGNEGHGPNRAWAEAEAQMVHIPMPGRAESLNAGVAAAVVLYEALRQRTTGCDSVKLF